MPRAVAALGVALLLLAPAARAWDDASEPDGPGTGEDVVSTHPGSPPKAVLKYVEPGPEIRLGSDSVVVGDAPSTVEDDPVVPAGPEYAAMPVPEPMLPPVRSVAEPEPPPQAAEPNPGPVRAVAGNAAPRQRFATRHAQYVPVAWHEIPGWREGATRDAWSAFVQGCTVLSERQAWRPTCERARAARPATPAAAREFFEREFEAFQIRSAGAADTGILTGYFEVALEGSRVRTERFRYPVYAVPNDLLFLDARLLSRRAPPGRVRVEGREVVPADDGASASYRLAVARVPGAVRDGKIRVRRSGDRIVPYFTRQEIERGGLAAAEAIAWVEDPELLYSLHIEGSGRIRVGPGQVVRVAFGEQNGHPFRPTVSVDGPRLARGRDEAGRSEAGRLVDFFISPAAASEGDSGASPRVLVSSVRDPSYVFFRRIPNTDGGPPGAMGVPLTAGTSLAVDPRVTPLGAPVFIAARSPGSTAATRRLMVAQDTGGAIRGALRADYFLGYGGTAGAIAMQMKDELRMWVLLPKHLAIAARHAASGSRPACVLADPEFCAD